MRTRAWGAGPFLLIAVSSLACAALVPRAAAAQTVARPSPPLSLQDLEGMALEQNPTLPQARASIRAAEGRETQAGLYPNPLVGYEAEEINTREPGRFKNFFWLQVPIVTAGARRASRGDAPRGAASSATGCGCRASASTRRRWSGSSASTRTTRRSIRRTSRWTSRCAGRS